MSQLVDMDLETMVKDWVHGKGFSNLCSAQERQFLMNFVHEALKLCKINKTYREYSWFILILPVFFHLFEGKGYKDDRVKFCQAALDTIEGAKESLRN